MLIVFDPNAFVSAVVANGVSRRLFDLWREHRQFELVVCPLLLEELSEVLHRARFRAVITSGEVDALVTFLRNELDHPEITVLRPDEALARLSSLE